VGSEILGQQKSTEVLLLNSGANIQLEIIWIIIGLMCDILISISYLNFCKKDYFNLFVRKDYLVRNNEVFFI